MVTAINKDCTSCVNLRHQIFGSRRRHLLRRFLWLAGILPVRRRRQASRASDQERGSFGQTQLPARTATHPSGQPTRPRPNQSLPTSAPKREIPTSTDGLKWSTTPPSKGRGRIGSARPSRLSKDRSQFRCSTPWHPAGHKHLHTDQGFPAGAIGSLRPRLSHLTKAHI